MWNYITAGNRSSTNSSSSVDSQESIVRNLLLKNRYHGNLQTLRAHGKDLHERSSRVTQMYPELKTILRHTMDNTSANELQMIQQIATLSEQLDLDTFKTKTKNNQGSTVHQDVLDQLLLSVVKMTTGNKNKSMVPAGPKQILVPELGKQIIDWVHNCDDMWRVIVTLLVMLLMVIMKPEAKSGALKVAFECQKRLLYMNKTGKVSHLPDQFHDRLGKVMKQAAAISNHHEKHNPEHQKSSSIVSKVIHFHDHYNQEKSKKRVRYIVQFIRHILTSGVLRWLAH